MYGVGRESHAGVDLVVGAVGDRLQSLGGRRRQLLIPAVGVGRVAGVQVQGRGAEAWSGQGRTVATAQFRLDLVQCFLVILMFEMGGRGSNHVLGGAVSDFINELV